MLVSNFICRRCSDIPEWRDTYYTLQITNLDAVPIEFDVNFFASGQAGAHLIFPYLRAWFN